MAALIRRSDPEVEGHPPAEGPRTLRLLSHRRFVGSPAKGRVRPQRSRPSLATPLSALRPCRIVHHERAVRGANMGDRALTLNVTDETLARREAPLRSPRLARDQLRIRSRHQPPDRALLASGRHPPTPLRPSRLALGAASP